MAIKRLAKGFKEVISSNAFHWSLLRFMDQQDEYEELLRYAVVTPKLDPHTSAHLQLLSTSHPPAEGRSSLRKDGTKPQRPAGTLSHTANIHTRSFP